MAHCREIENILQYSFHNTSLLDEALHAAGATHKPALPPRQHGNKPLALIGDAILRLVIMDDGVVEGKTPGNCQQIYASEASNHHLAQVLRKWHLDDTIQTPGSLQGSVPQVTGASTIEAIIGAVWLDSGRDFGRTHPVVHNLHIAKGLQKEGHGSSGYA